MSCQGRYLYGIIKKPQFKNFGFLGYLYGIIKKPQFKNFGFLGVEDAEVYIISYQDLSLVVSNIEIGEIDLTRKNILAHTVVQDKLLKIYDLLPIGFGMIANSEDEALRLLKENYQALVEELERLSGKIEGDVKISWNREAVIKELQNEHQEFSKLKTKISTVSSPTIEAQNLLVEAGKLIEGIAMKWKIKYAQQVYNILKGFSVDTRLNDPIGIKNILNASFLIERPMEDKFKEEIYKLNSEYQDKLDFKYAGPLPPYNFVNIKLEL